MRRYRTHERFIKAIMLSVLFYWQCFVGNNNLNVMALCVLIFVSEALILNSFAINSMKNWNTEVYFPIFYCIGIKLQSIKKAFATTILILPTSPILYVLLVRLLAFYIMVLSYIGIYVQSPLKNKFFSWIFIMVFCDTCQEFNCIG